MRRSDDPLPVAAPHLGHTVVPPKFPVSRHSALSATADAGSDIFVLRCGP